MAESERQRFFSLWLKRLSESELLCYDITSVSSYATANEYVRWGYNRDGESLPQINMAMLYGQKSGLPAYYRRLPGNISDTKTLQTTMAALGFLGKAKLRFVLDRGFYSESNVDALLGKRYRFVVAVPAGRVWVRDIIDQCHGQTVSPEHYRQTGEGEALYMASHIHSWNGRRCYAHLYYNAARAAEEFDSLTRKLIACKKELEEGKRKEANEELYERFFTVKSTPKRGASVAYNEEEIQKHRKRHAGFFCILTNVKMDSGELLDLYRRKEVVENCFDDLKNGLNMKRLRVHSSGAMDGRLFIQFLALALISRIRMAAKGHEGLKYKGAREMLEAMETVVRVTFPGRRGSIVTETGPLQRKIIEAFGLQLDT
jgi:transposase